MIVKLYAVLDACSAVYDGPHPNANDKVAIRNFENMALQDGNAVSRNPEHFSLWRIGSYDDARGELHEEEKVQLIHAQDIVNARYNEAN